MSVALCRLGTGFVAELLRHGLGDTHFHNGALGLSATSTAGLGKGFNREPGGTLNSMTTGGTSYYYLTDALGSVVAHTDESGTKVSSCGYSPRGVQRGTTSEQLTQPSRFAGGYQDPRGPLPLRRPLLRPQHRPLHQPRPVRPGGEPLPLRRRRPRHPHRPTAHAQPRRHRELARHRHDPPEGFTGGTGAAETATAAMIADVGITALCAAGAAGNPGARSCQPEEGAGMMSVLAAPPLLQDGQSAVIFTVAFIVIVALLLVFWRFKGR